MGNEWGVSQDVHDGCVVTELVNFRYLNPPTVGITLIVWPEPYTNICPSSLPSK